MIDNTPLGHASLTKRALWLGVAFTSLLLVSPVALTSKAHAQEKLSLIGFSGATNLPVWVAKDAGFFQREGLDVETTVTSGSVEQVRDMMSGRYQIMTSAFDNIVAYANGEGDVKLGQNFDFVAIMGVHSGMNSLVATKDIAKIEDIKGKIVAVDAVRSGYAVIMYKILEKHGLKFDVDYKVLAVGSTSERMKAMEEGKAVAAMIATPTDLEAVKKGYRILADGATEIGAYQGSAFVVRRSWAKDNEKVLAQFVRAISASMDSIFADRATTMKVLKARLPKQTDEELNAIYDRVTGPGGLNKGAVIREEAVRVVLDLRIAAGTPTSLDMSKYIDPSIQQRALKK